MSVTILAKKLKQPTEVKTYQVNLAPFFSNRTDTPTSVDVSVQSGLTLVTSSLVGQVVHIRVSGGTDGEAYLVTVNVTTSTGDVEEANFLVAVADIVL